MRIQPLLTLALVALVAGCATESIDDDLAGDDGEGTDGKADADGAFTYFAVTGTTNLSVAQVNKSQTTCGDGARRSTCRVRAIDYTGTGLDAAEIAAATAGKDILVRGTLAGDTVSATELWVGKRATSGIYVKLRDSATVCATLRCEIHDEIKLNSTLRSKAAELDVKLTTSERELADLHAAIGQDGLVIAGDRYYAGELKARTVRGAFTRVGSKRRWNVHDVSILFPLPKDGEANLLLRMTDGGGLFTEDMFRMLGSPATGMPFLTEGPGRDGHFPNLRVTSVRIDPCHDEPSPTATTRCVRQVRLVVQPLYDGSFYDASIHLFYELDDAAFVTLLARMRAVGLGASPHVSLGVHPAMENEGLRGPTATAIRAALLEACNLQRLTKFTIMATGRSKNWFFFAIAKNPDGSFARVRGETTEGGFSDHGLPAQRDPAPTNDPAFPDDLLATASVQAASETALLAGIDKLERLANPKLAKTSETRCASCHAAATTLDHVLELTETPAVPRTRNAFATSSVVQHRHGFSNHHAFSYFGDEPAVSRRAANDSIATVRFLSSNAFLSSLAPELRAKLD